MYSDTEVLLKLINVPLMNMATMHLMHLRASSKYVVLVVNLNVYIYEIDSNFSLLCQFVVIGTMIYDAQFVEFTLVLTIDS